MAGRPRAKIDMVELEKLCALNCTVPEIAAWFGVNEKTIDRLAKDPEFGEVITRGRAKGRISIRRSQMRMLEEGNATMAIWLGKQLLGQSDRLNLEITDADKRAATLAAGRERARQAKEPEGE